MGRNSNNTLLSALSMMLLQNMGKFWEIVHWNKKVTFREAGSINLHP